MHPKAVHDPMTDNPAVEEITDKKEILLQRAQKTRRESRSFDLYGDFDERNDDKKNNETEIGPFLQKCLDAFVIDKTKHAILNSFDCLAFRE